jgi:chromosome segregation ATPase
MSTQLASPPVKVRVSSAQETEEPSRAVPPAQIYPARVQLTSKLSEFEKAISELDDYKARAERARIDADRAMEDPQLSETEAAERIQTSQLQGNIYKARQAQREKAIAALSSDLTNVIRQANSELQGLVNREVERRREIIGARVLEVAGATDTSRPGLKPALADLLNYSEPILRVQALAPRPLITLSGNSESLVQSSKDVLEKYSAVIAEAARTI